MIRNTKSKLGAHAHIEITSDSIRYVNPIQIQKLIDLQVQSKVAKPQFHFNQTDIFISSNDTLIHNVPQSNYHVVHRDSTLGTRSIQSVKVDPSSTSTEIPPTAIILAPSEFDTTSYQWMYDELSKLGLAYQYQDQLLSVNSQPVMWISLPHTELTQGML